MKSGNLTNLLAAKLITIGDKFSLYVLETKQRHHGTIVQIDGLYMLRCQGITGRYPQELVTKLLISLGIESYRDYSWVNIRDSRGTSYYGLWENYIGNLCTEYGVSSLGYGYSNKYEGIRWDIEYTPNEKDIQEFITQLEIKDPFMTILTGTEIPTEIIRKL